MMPHAIAPILDTRLAAASLLDDTGNSGPASVSHIRRRASGFLAYLLRTFRKCFISNSSHDLSMPFHFHFRLSLVNFCALRRILWPLVNIIWVEQFIKVTIDEDAGWVLASNCCNLCDDRRPFGNDILTAQAQAAIWQLQTDSISNCQETCAYCCAKLYKVPVKSNVM